MNKIQKFPKTVGDAIKTNDPTQGVSTDTVGLNTVLENLAGGMMTQAYKDYLDGILNGQKQQAANALFTRVVTDTVPTYYVDETTEANMTGTRTILFKFNNVAVDPSSANGLSPAYTKSATGTYTYALTKASGAPGVTNIKYNIPSGTYQGMTASMANIGSKDVTASPIAYYGWFSSNDIAQLATLFVAGNMIGASAAFSSANKFKRLTGAISGSSVKHAVDGTELYLWVITKGSVSAKDDMQIEAMNQKSGTHSLTSPMNGNITLSGYKVYISENKLNNTATLKTTISL